MGNTILVPLIAVLVLGAIWQFTFMRTRSTISAFTAMSIALGFIVFQLLSKDTPTLMAYFVASGIFAHLWAFAWVAYKRIPYLRKLLKEEDKAIFPTLVDKNMEGGGR